MGSEMCIRDSPHIVNERAVRPSVGGGEDFLCPSERHWQEGMGMVDMKLSSRRPVEEAWSPILEARLLRKA